MKTDAKVLVLGGLLLAGCESVSVGTAIPVRGPVKPTVGVSVGKSGVKGHGGVAGTVGRVPVGVSGTTKPLKVENQSAAASKTSATKKKTK